ncbi:hypothetical protein [Dyella sp. C11]|uniref:hypothetical protein n=1 Tax=Dyella sp. C11 TaxID=2126991 RepID=UPI0013008B23|nr:hypothetical protein [Dyella sp. C11]
MLGPAPFPLPPSIPTPAPPPSAAKPRRRLPFWAGVLIGVALTLALVIGVGGYLFFTLGWKAFRDQAVTAMDQQRVIQQCIGKIESSSLEVIATGNEDRDNGFVFHIKGPRSSGRVSAVFTTVDADHERIDEGELKLDDGRTFKLSSEEDEDDDNEGGLAGCPTT